MTDASAWIGDDGEEKGQIDLVIDRRDRGLSQNEAQFSETANKLTKTQNIINIYQALGGGQ